MLITEFDFELPDALIAQEPLQNREKSRMLAVNRTAQTFKDESFSDFPKFLQKGDVVVLNNTKVFPARLFGTSETGAKTELRSQQWHDREREDQAKASEGCLGCHGRALFLREAKSS